MKHSSRQFGDYFSGFGRQSEKFSRIGTCIRRNFTPCYGYKVINQLYDFKGGFTTFGQLLGTVNIVLTVKGHFLDATRAATQFPVTRNSQITDNLLKSSFSRAILDI